MWHTWLSTITYLFSAVQLSLGCLAMTDPVESFPLRSYSTHQPRSQAGGPRRWLLQLELQHVKDCPARSQVGRLLLQVHTNSKGVRTATSWKNAQLLEIRRTLKMFFHFVHFPVWWINSSPWLIIVPDFLWLYRLRPADYRVTVKFKHLSRYIQWLGSSLLSNSTPNFCYFHT